MDNIKINKEEAKIIYHWSKLVEGEYGEFFSEENKDDEIDLQLKLEKLLGEEVIKNINNELL